MIRRLTRGKSLPTGIATEIVDRTDGVPLFVEKLTKAVLGGIIPEQVDGFIGIRTCDRARPELAPEPVVDAESAQTPRHRSDWISDLRKWR